MTDFQKFVEHFADYSVVLVIFLTLASGILSALAKVFTSRRMEMASREVTAIVRTRTTDSAPTPGPSINQAFQVARSRAVSRLREVETSRNEQTSTYKL